MSLSMYQASAPVLLRGLGNLRHILEKGAAHAEVRKIDPAVLVNFRLYPDMFPLSRQVQIASDQAKGCMARLSGTESPKYEDTETTFAQLIARIDKTAEFVKSFKAEQIDGSENREVTLQTPLRALKFTGQQYLFDFVLPNLHFHSTTAYNILRHNGVELGKMDYLGATG